MGNESLRVLLADDDDSFREVLSRVLTEAGFAVDAVADGEAARGLLGLETYALVLSDIRMPRLDGFELLEWAKSRTEVPFILMTAYAQGNLAEVAGQKGASLVLFKPFGKEVLLAAIRGLLDTNAPIAQEDTSDGEYYRVSIDDFIANKELPFTLFIRLAERKFVKIAHASSDLGAEQLDSYKGKGVKHLYMRAEDYRQYVGFTLRITTVLNKSSAISKERKQAFMKHAGEVILEKVFVDGVDEEGFGNARVFLESAVELLTSDEGIFNMLSALNEHSDFVYAQSLGTSLYSVMIARALGWKAPSTLFKIATAGLFHDIGLKELDRELIEKPRIAQTAAERKEYETHPLRGAEILSHIGNVPLDVIQVASQHHEDIAGNGYPKHLNKAKILPLARLVAVADVFCDYVIRGPDSSGLTADAAIHQMECLQATALDPQFLAAFKAALKPKPAEPPRGPARHFKPL